MRAREMHNKLDRLAPASEDDEHNIPDLTLLSPELQDWVDEIIAKIEGMKDEDDFHAKVKEGFVTEAELRKLNDLWTELPALGPHEGFKGPN